MGRYHLLLMSMLVNLQASAERISYPVPWQGIPPLPGNGQAGICHLSTSFLAPFGHFTRIQVGNDTPNGTVLYSWDYAHFLTISKLCNGNGTQTTSPSVFFFSRTTSQLPWSNYNSALRAFTNFANIPGIGIRVFIRVDRQVNAWGSGITNPEGNWFLGLYPIGQEFEMTSPTIGFWMQEQRLPARPAFMHNTLNWTIVSMRAELIKTGNITYSSSPIIVPTPTFIDADVPSANLSPPDFLGSGRVWITPPVCRLTTPGTYTVNLGQWLGAGLTPRTGSGVPINLALECNGGVGDVQIAFQDTGGTPQTNDSVGLYDPSGNKIAGLEVEMRYNNTRINVGKSTDATSVLSKVSVGARAGGSGPNTNRTFTGATPAQFTAHFVQRNPITRGGVSYAGPVSGQVNIWVTYN
ncbi:fimbrial protein [Aeromonas veronii]